MSNRPTRRRLLRFGAVALPAALAGCTSFAGREDGGDGTDDGADDGTGSTATPTPPPDAWRTTELTDVRTGETFTIDRFSGETVLLESFAVWCPTCTKQQREIAALHERVGDGVVSVSVDVDPSEDESTVRQHIEEHGFDWRFAVSPPPMTESLERRFGLPITYAPGAPVVRVCPDGSATLIGHDGVKSADVLRSRLKEC